MSYTKPLTQIRDQAVLLARQAWPTLGDLVDMALPDPLDPVALLPIATGVAAGGAIPKLIPIAVSVVLTALSLRIADDCADQDDPHALYASIGVGRAVNYAMALQTVVSRHLVANGLSRRMLGVFHDYCQSLLLVYHGQDEDMQRRIQSLDEYEALVKHKTVPAYEFAASAGARAVTTDAQIIERCATCGVHLGWMAQILDDVEALWFPVGDASREVQKVTLPVLWGTKQSHPNAALVQAFIEGTDLDREAICLLLDEMDVRHQLMHLALDHRDQALYALREPLAIEGKVLLYDWLEWHLGNAAQLLRPLAQPAQQQP